MEFGALAEEFVALNKTKQKKQNYLVVSSNAHRYSDPGEKEIEGKRAWRMREKQSKIVNKTIDTKYNKKYLPIFGIGWNT